jgi:MurNAc alpha-1-phosphate uridylyltransferase
MGKRAMVLAAGLGVRMRPLTDTRPKALVELHGVTMLDRAFAKCRAVGVSSIVVNSHYKAEMIHSHVAAMGDIVLSPEDELLETGGGVCKALPHLGSQPFFVVNCDSVWNDKSRPALERLSETWWDDAMDGLLLLQRREVAVGYDGAGDFSIDAAGRMRRCAEGDSTPLVFMGVQLLHPRLFEGCIVARYSLNRLYDQALAAGRLFGLVHDGDWFHVGTPEDLAVTERLMRADGSGE